MTPPQREFEYVLVRRIVRRGRVAAGSSLEALTLALDRESGETITLDRAAWDETEVHLAPPEPEGA